MQNNYQVIPENPEVLFLSKVLANKTFFWLHHCVNEKISQSWCYSQSCQNLSRSEHHAVVGNIILAFSFVKPIAPALAVLKCWRKWRFSSLYLACKWKKPSIYLEVSRHQVVRDAYSEVESYRADVELLPSPSSFLLSWIKKGKQNIRSRGKTNMLHISITSFVLWIW